MPTTTVQISPTCSQLVVTTNGPPITSIVGRSNGNNIKFVNYSYEQLKMKRKATVLLYPSKEITKKNNYSSIINNNYYSQSKLLSFINSKSQKCPNVISTSSASGVVGSNTIYYNDPNVPYYPNI